MKKVSIVIPVYNHWDLVKRNIDALLQHEERNIREIIIVNDDSPNENPYVFDSSIVQMITNDKNIGYTGTVNNGLKKAVSDVIVLLDSDAYPVEPFIERLLKLYKNPAIGCVGFRTIDETGNETGSFERFEPSVIGLIVGQQLQLRLDRIGILGKKKILPYSCTVSFRKKCLQDLEYFDACSFPILEADNDIAMRLHRSDWKLLLSRKITFCHSGGNSYKINYKRVLLYHESRWKLLKKHGKLRFPLLTKELIKMRIKSELIILTFLSILNSGHIALNEKIQGRKIILNTVNTFN